MKCTWVDAAAGGGLSAASEGDAAVGVGLQQIHGARVERRVRDAAWERRLGAQPAHHVARLDPAYEQHALQDVQGRRGRVRTENHNLFNYIDTFTNEAELIW